MHSAPSKFIDATPESAEAYAFIRAWMAGELDADEEPYGFIGRLDRTEYIRSQMDAHPEHANMIASDMFHNPGRYPIFERAIRYTGSEIGHDPNGDARSFLMAEPGELRFIGWMLPEEHYVWSLQREREREAARDEAVQRYG